MNITLKHLGDSRFEAVAGGGQRVTVSGAGDKNAAGPRPMEMVLIGLGGCSGVDVLAILERGRQRVTSCDIAITATRADAVPAVFTDIHLHYTVGGDDLDRHKVARAVALSVEKYCSVARMLADAVTIRHDFSIVTDHVADHAGSNADVV